MPRPTTRGSRHRSSDLGLRAEVLSLRDQGYAAAQIASRYGVSKTRIYQIYAAARRDTAPQPMAGSDSGLQITVCPVSLMPTKTRKISPYTPILRALETLLNDQCLRVSYPTAEPPKRKQWVSALRRHLRDAGYRLTLRSDGDFLWISPRIGDNK